MDDKQMLELIAEIRIEDRPLLKQELMDSLRDQLIDEAEYVFLVPDIDALERWLRS